MDERDVVRLTRMVAGIVATIVAMIASPAHAADVDVARGVSDGTCSHPEEGVVAGLAADVAAANALGGCIPLDSPMRAPAEWAEQGRIVDAYHRFVEDVCTARKCYSNELAAWLLARENSNDLWVEQHVMAGCGMWAEFGSNAVVAERPRYWTIQRVKYVKNDANAISHVASQAVMGETFHWLVVLTNTRTGEQFALDGWTAAEKSRPWLAFGAGADPRRIDRRDELRSSEDVNSWGHPAESAGCDNEPGTLCNPTKCGKS